MDALSCSTCWSTEGSHGWGKRILILEAIADTDTYFWYIFFGECGSLNDLNVLDKSLIVGSILSGTFDTSVDPYCVNETNRDWLYFLADGIYPDWSIFVKTISSPISTKEAKYATSQEGVWKDVERAFGVIVQRFHFLKGLLRNWYLKDIKNTLYCSIIMHNMIVECRRPQYKAASLGLDDAGNEVEMDPERKVPNLISLFGRTSVDGEEDDHTVGEEIQSELASRVGTVYANVQDCQLYNQLRDNLIHHQRSSSD